MSLEHWQAGPVAGVPGPLQPVAHALLQARDDVGRAGTLPPRQLWAEPGGAASVGWHLLHLAGSTDRLLTYARGEPLSEAQRAALAQERALPAHRPSAVDLVARFGRVVEAAVDQLRVTRDADLAARRELGRARIPVTVLGLLFHAAEHAARHAGQVITTIKVVVAADPPDG